MPGLRRCSSLLVTLICISGVAGAQTDNPPPAKPLSAYGSFELRPLGLDSADAARKGKQHVADSLQRQLTAKLAPILAGWNAKPPAEDAPRLVIEPRIESVKKVGGATRYFAGSAAGDSYVEIRVRLIEQPGDVVIAEPSFYQQGSAETGYWSMGASDNSMLPRIAQLIANYLNSNYAEAVGGPTGRQR